MCKHECHVLCPFSSHPSFAWSLISKPARLPGRGPDKGSDRHADITRWHGKSSKAVCSNHIVYSFLFDLIVLQFVTVPKHKKYPPAGVKTQLRTNSIWIDQADAKELKEGEEVTLMDWGNAIVKSFTRDESGLITAIDADLHLEGDFK